MTTQPLSGSSTVRTQAGNLLPAAPFNRDPGPQKKFLLVFQYWEGDREEAEEQAHLIADLERVRQKDIDILVFGRNDAMPFGADTISKLRLKFNAVFEQKCSRTDAKGYPFGSNGMFYELVTMFGQQARWLNAYYAFMNLEPDCCPLSPGWLNQLIAEFKSAVSEEKYALGYVHNNPVTHLNGVAVYSIDIWRRVPGGALGGGSPNIVYDVRQAKNLMPMARHTALIQFSFRRPTITPDILQELTEAGVVMYHGVKDGSARAWVRERHITQRPDSNAPRPSVYTFFNPVDEQTADEAKQQLALWREGWSSRGWNPVVLRAPEAQKNGKHAALMAAVNKFPRLGDPHEWRNDWLKYLALDTVGGGLFAERHVLPVNFAPIALKGLPPFASLDPRHTLFHADREGLAKWFDEVMNYSVHEDDKSHGKPHVEDRTIIKKFQKKPLNWVALMGSKDLQAFRAVRFIDVANERKPVSKRMEEFLQGV